jgi:hypothetical protein
MTAPHDALNHDALNDDALNHDALNDDALTDCDVLTDLDRRITAAYRALGIARARFGEAPSGEGVVVCVTAEATVDDLLDQRYLLTHQPVTAPA